MLRSRAQAADLREALVELALIASERATKTFKSGHKVDITLAGECEFSCNQNALYKIYCKHHLDDEDDYYVPERYACVKHVHVKKIACECSGKKGCPVVGRVKLSAEMTDSLPLFDEVAFQEEVDARLIETSGRFGRILRAFEMYKYYKDVESQENVKAIAALSAKSSIVVEEVMAASSAKPVEDVCVAGVVNETQTVLRAEAEAFIPKPSKFNDFRIPKTVYTVEFGERELSIALVQTPVYRYAKLGTNLLDEAPENTGKYKFIQSSRGKRAGWRVNSKLPGKCANKLLPRGHRHIDFGFFPPIEVPLQYLKENSLVPLNKRIEFNYQYGVHGAHVVEDKGWNFVRQAKIILAKDRGRILGATTEQFAENYCFVDHFDTGTLNDELVQAQVEASKLLPNSPYDPDEDDDKPDVYAMPGYEDQVRKRVEERSKVVTEDMLQEYERQQLSALSSEKVEEPVMVDRMVRGTGLCWTKMGFIPKGVNMSKPESSCCVSLEQVNEVVQQKKKEKMYIFLKIREMPDCDYHLDDAVMINHFTWISDYFDRSKYDHWCKPKDLEKFPRQYALVGKATPSPVEKALNTVSSPEVRVGVERALQVPMADMINEALEICPWQIPEKNQHHMQEIGLPWIQAGPQHVHPIHAAIRRRILLRELPAQIKCDTTFISMKPEHHNMVVREVRKRNPNVDWKLPLVNPILDIKDIARYAGTSTVTHQVFGLDPIKTPAVHIDEAWHYLTPEFMDGLARKNPGVVHVTATSIFPLMSLHLEQSPEPDLYGFVVHKDKHKNPLLTYWMEGRVSEKYTQPFDPSMILARRIESTDGKIVWNGGAIFKMLNTRLHVFSRFQVEAPRFDIELENKYIKLPKVFRNQPELPMMRLDHFNKIADYARVMPKDTAENYWGKWRLMMLDEGIHLPWGAKEWMINVIVECKRLSKVPSMQSRDIESLPHSCYYHTVGKLRKVIHKHLVMPYAKRRMEMISQHSPVMVFPTLGLVVKPWRSSETLYSIAWKVDEDDDGRNFWQKFSMFLKSWGHKGDPPTSMNIDLGGHIRFPFSANTWLQQQRHGIPDIRESQVKAFNTVFEDSVPEEKPIFKVEARKYEITQPDRTHLITKKDGTVQLTNKAVPRTKWARTTLVNIGEVHSLKKVMQTDDALDSILEESEDSEESFVEELPELEPELQHCVDCDTFTQFKDKGGADDPRAYELYWRGKHQGELMHRQRNLYEALSIAASRRTPSLHDSLPLPDTETKEVVRIPESTAKPFDIGFKCRICKSSSQTRLVAEEGDICSFCKGKAVVRPTYDRDRDQLYRQALVNKVEPFEQKETTNLRTPKMTYDERVTKWEAYRKNLTKFVAEQGAASGALLWDLLFKTSVDKRYEQIPFRDIVHYPGNPYPKNDCLLEALSAISGVDPPEVLFRMQRAYKRSALNFEDNMDEKLIWPFALYMSVTIIVQEGDHERYYGVRGKLFGVIKLQDGHFSPVQGFRVPLMIQSYKEVGHFRVNPTVNAILAWQAAQAMPWIPERSRADKLIRAILNGEIGLINQPVNREALLGWSSTVDIGYKSQLQKKLIVVMGDPGCRKSTTPQKAMKSNRTYMHWGMIAPTNQIARDYRDKLDATSPDNRGKKMHGDMVLTWESALARSAGANMVILDENKYPPGYISLLNILNPTIEYTMLLGDIWQAAWHSPSPTNLNDEISELEFYSDQAKGFIVGTWRFSGLSAAFWRMPSYSKINGGWAFTKTMPTVWTSMKQYFPFVNDHSLLEMWKGRQEYTSAHFQAVFAEEIRGSEARSYSGSIGVTAPLAIIHVDEAVMRGSDPRLIYTAMTRSAFILFVYTWAHNGRSEVHEVSHPVFRVLKRYRERYKLGKRLKFVPEDSLSIREIYKPFPQQIKIWMAGPFENCTNFDVISQWWPRKCWDDVIDPDAKMGGARLTRSESSYVDAPEFQPFIDETPEFTSEEPATLDYMPPERSVPTKVPVERRQDFVEYHTAQVKERFDADKLVRGELTNQFDDLPRFRFDGALKLASLIEQAPGRNKREKRQYVVKMLERVNRTDDDPRYSQDPILLWAAYQRRDDHASWLMAKAQRIRFSTPENNMLNYFQQTRFGDCCWNAFKHYMGWTTPVPWNELLYHKAVEEFQFRRGDRSEALKVGSLNRADPNFNITITLKQQLKLKDEEWKPAKAPQPVWIHPDHQLFTEGPYGVLLLNLLLEHKPPWWHFHARESYHSFETWATEYMSKYSEFEMNDLVGQDQSTQGWAVRVMENLMLWFNFPQHAIDEFKHNKIHKTLDGRVFIAIMTDSGEVWTFMINTISSTARECFMYNLQPGHPQANGGDDTWRAVAGPVNPAYAEFKDMDPCEDKRYVSPRGDFTSYCFKEGILFKNPIILLKRFLVRLATGRGEEAVLGYFEMFERNYALKEKIMSVMTEEELMAHNITTRIFMNLKGEGIRTRVTWKNVEGREYYSNFDTDYEVLPNIDMNSFNLLRSIQQMAPVFTTASAIVPNISAYSPIYDQRLSAYTAEW